MTDNFVLSSSCFISCSGGGEFSVIIFDLYLKAYFSLKMINPAFPVNFHILVMLLENK